MDATPMTALLSQLAEVFTQVITWVTTVGTTIVGSPLLLIGVSLPIIGVGVGMFKRLLRV